MTLELFVLSISTGALLGLLIGLSILTIRRLLR